VSQNDSFFHEVNEDVRRDSLRRGFLRYGWLIALLVIAAIGGAAFYEWRKHSDQRSAEQAGDALRAAFLETDPTKRAEALAGVATAEPSAAAVAWLAEAGSQIEAGNTDAASTTLATLADDGAAPELYRQLASLLRVMLLGDAMDASERAATLETLASSESPFQPLALEQRALLKLGQGDKDGALKDLDTILTLPQAPQQLSDRARQLIVAAGGTVPANGVVTAPASDG
jgi:hypothetical protein